MAGVEQAVALYADGNSIYDIGSKLGCSPEWARQLLLKAAVQMRGGPKRGGRKGLSPLAEELFDDLDDQFPDGATLLMLVGWLGETAAAIERAMGELIGCGWAIRMDGRYFPHVPTRPGRQAGASAYDREALQEAIRKGERPRRTIANDFGVTIGVVSGVAHRMSRGSAAK